jgi:hypothetical protein
MIGQKKDLNSNKPIRFHLKLNMGITDVPKLEGSMPLICFILNIFTGGWGTILAAILDPNGFNLIQLIIGIVQSWLAYFLVGWIWGLIWGWLIFKAPSK